MVWSFPVHTHAHTHLLCLRATCPNLDGFLPFFVLYDKQLDQCWTVTNKKTRHLKTSAQTLGIHDGYFSLLSRLSSDQLILPIIVAANQLFLYNWKTNFRCQTVNSPRQQHGASVRAPPLSSRFIVPKFHFVSAHFIMFHCVCCQSAAGHTKKKEPLPEKWSENLGVFVLLEQKLISSLVWHEKKKKKKKIRNMLMWGSERMTARCWQIGKL